MRARVKKAKILKDVLGGFSECEDDLLMDPVKKKFHRLFADLRCQA